MGRRERRSPDRLRPLLDLRSPLVLAQLFVQPDLQASGVGRELLAKTLHQAESRNASARALITFAFNRTSQGLYMRHGLYPLCQLYVMSVPRDTLASHHIRSRLRQLLEPSAPVIERLAKIDKAALGVSRSKHHQYWLPTAICQGSRYGRARTVLATPISGRTDAFGPWGLRKPGLSPMHLRLPWLLLSKPVAIRSPHSCREPASPHLNSPSVSECGSPSPCF